MKYSSLHALIIITVYAPNFFSGRVWLEQFTSMRRRCYTTAHANKISEHAQN